MMAPGYFWVDDVSLVKVGPEVARLPADGAGGSPVASPPVRGWGAIDVAAMGGTGRDSAVAALDDRAAVAATFTDLLEGRATVAFAPLCRCPGRARPADV